MATETYIFLGLLTVACLFSLFMCVTSICDISKLEERLEQLESKYSSLNVNLKRVNKKLK